MDHNKSELIATRLHDVIKARKHQLEDILMAYSGGKPYIDSRLNKFPCETSTEFRNRKQQAFLSNYLRRITDQISQSIFAIEPKRNNIDIDFYHDVSLTGDNFGINDLMAEVNKYLTIAGWCWVRVDRLGSPTDEDGNPIDQSISLKQQRGDRIYLSAYSPLQVVDWGFDAVGRLKWVLTEEEFVKDSDSAFEASRKIKARTLYQDGEAIVYEIKSDATGKKSAKEIERTSYSYNQPPFILVGKPSDEPHIYDDIESIQSSLLNLESSYNYSLWRSHFSVLVISEGCISAMMEQPDVKDSGEAVDLIISEGRALTEDADSKNLTRYISPSAADKQVIPDQIQFLKQEIHDTLGMMLRKPGRQAESAEAKAWDYKQIEAFLKQRANYLQFIEEKIVEMALSIDPDFEFYDPFYNKDFAIRDLKNELETIILGLGIEGIEDKIKDELRKQAFGIIASLPSSTISDEVIDEVDSQ